MRSLWLFALLLLSPSAHAAQDAIIAVDQATIREKPEAESKALEVKIAGEKVRISSFQKNGWYKVKASAGQFGWIWQADVTIEALSSDVKSANIEVTPRNREKRKDRSLPFLFLKAGGFLFPLLSDDLSTSLNLGSHFYPTFGGFLELSTSISERIRAGLRFSTYSHTSTQTVPGDTYDVTLSSTPLLVGLEGDLSRGEFFDLSLGAYAGLAYKNKILVIAQGKQAPDRFSQESSPLAFMANVSAKYWFTRWFAGIFEAGLLYSSPSEFVVPQFNGDAPFRDRTSGALKSVKASQYGPLFSLGVEFSY